MMRGSDNVDLPTLVLHKFLSCYLAVFVHIHMIQNRYIHGKYLELSGILIMASYWLRVISKIYRQWGSSWTDSFSHQFDEIRKPTDRRNRWWCPKLNNRGSKGQQRKKPSRQKLLGKARGHRVEGHQRSAPGLCRKSPVNIWKMIRFERTLRNPL